MPMSIAMSAAGSGFDADMVGVRSGVTTVVDQGGPSVLTFPGFREYVVKPAGHPRPWAFISAYMVGEAWKITILSSTGPTASRSTTHGYGPGRDNADLVRGVKGIHAEIGGFTRWGSAAMRQASSFARSSQTAALHPFRPALAAAEPGSHDPVPSCPRCWDSASGDVLAHPFTRCPAASSIARVAASRGAGGAGAQAQDRRGPRLHFSLGWRGWCSMPASFRTRLAPTCMAAAAVPKRLTRHDVHPDTQSASVRGRAQRFSRSPRP